MPILPLNFPRLRACAQGIRTNGFLVDGRLRPFVEASYTSTPVRPPSVLFIRSWRSHARSARPRSSMTNHTLRTTNRSSVSPPHFLCISNLSKRIGRTRENYPSVGRACIRDGRRGRGRRCISSFSRRNSIEPRVRRRGV